MDINVQANTKQEYDDNNYFDAVYISNVFGIEVDWGSYTFEDEMPELLKDIKKLLPANSMKFITETKDSEHVLKQIEALKETDEWKWSTEMIDFFIKCLKEGHDLDKAVEHIQEKATEYGVY